MSLPSTLSEFKTAIADTKQIAADAHVWSTLDWIALNSRISEIYRLANESLNEPSKWKSLTWTSFSLPNDIPLFTIKHKELVTKLAFLQSFLSWELFLEETFLLYLMGNSVPKVSIRRLSYGIPSNRIQAEGIIKNTVQTIHKTRFPDWTRSDRVVQYAQQFFYAGAPFDSLNLYKSILEETKVIRNSVAHASSDSQNKFKSLVRTKLGAYPPGMTQGGFLATTIPGSTPPESFLENYLSVLIYLADQIIPM